MAKFTPTFPRISSAIDSLLGQAYIAGDHSYNIPVTVSMLSGNEDTGAIYQVMARGNVIGTIELSYITKRRLEVYTPRLVQ